MDRGEEAGWARDRDKGDKERVDKEGADDVLMGNHMDKDYSKTYYIFYYPCL